MVLYNEQKHYLFLSYQRLQGIINALVCFFAANKDKMTEVMYRRARHVITEIERTTNAVKALESDDYNNFGNLMNQSHDSLR